MVLRCDEREFLYNKGKAIIDNAPRLKHHLHRILGIVQNPMDLKESDFETTYMWIFELLVKYRNFICEADRLELVDWFNKLVNLEGKDRLLEYDCDTYYFYGDFGGKRYECENIENMVVVDE